MNDVWLQADDALLAFMTVTCNSEGHTALHCEVASASPKAQTGRAQVFGDCTTVLWYSLKGGIACGEYGPVCKRAVCAQGLNRIIPPEGTYS